MTARLAPPLKDAHRIVPHLLNCEPRSALDRESIRHPSPWRERWTFMFIGAYAVLAGAGSGSMGDTMTLNLQSIGYTMDCEATYAKELDRANTLDKLRAVAEHWKPLANDAWQVVSKMDAAAFVEWRKGLRSERRGKFAGESFAEKYSDILMPATMFQVSIIANRSGAPWGCAYIQARKAGVIVEKDGIASYVQPEKTEKAS